MDFLHPLHCHQEELRLQALNRYRLLDTDREGSFDSITKLAALRLGTPIAVVSLVDRQRVWFKSSYGLNVQEVPCHLTADSPLLPEETLWISDTRSASDCRLPDEMARGIRFYAAAPLKTYHGFTLGTLSVMDYEPRDLDPRALGELEDLAASVMRQIETRRLKLRFRRSRSMFQPKSKLRCRSSPIHRSPTFDSLTALPDRHTLMDRLKDLLTTPTTTAGTLLAVDVEHFRILNGELGYAAGDQVLNEMARRLEALKGHHGTVARLGSDEFALLLPEVTSTSSALEAAQRLREALAVPVQLATGEKTMKVRVGVTVLGAQYQHPDEVLRDAEAALATARTERGNACRVFDAAPQRSIEERERLADEFRRAFERGEIRLVFQPVVHLGNDPVQGFEASVR